MRTVLFVAVLSLAVGCGGSGGGGNSPPAPPTLAPLNEIVDSYFPMEPGFHWTYAISCADPNLKLSTLHGVVEDKNWDQNYTDENGNPAVWHYEQRAIVWTATGSYLFTYQGTPYWVRCDVTVTDWYEIKNDVEIWWESSVATITLSFEGETATTTVEILPFVWDRINPNTGDRRQLMAQVLILADQHRPDLLAHETQDYSIEVRTSTSYSWDHDHTPYAHADYDYQTQTSIDASADFVFGNRIYNAVTVRRWGCAAFIGGNRTYVRGIGPLLTDRLDVEEGIELSSGITLALIDFGRAR